MARARNIKPGFFTNEDLAECTPWARLCFAGLWTLADREGRLEDRPKRVKGLLFPSDTIDVEPLLEELARWRFILRYEVDGRRLIQILAFHKHQNPHHREPPSDLPPPQSPGLDPVGNPPEPEAPPPLQPPSALGQPQASPGLDPPKSDLEGGSSRADSGFRIPDSGSLIPDSPSLIPDTGEGESTRKRAPAPPSSVVGSCPDDVEPQVWADWQALRRKKRAPVTETVMREARLEAGKAGLPLQRFLEVWCSRGSQGLQADWLTPSERGRTAAPTESAYERKARERMQAWAPAIARRPPGDPETIEAEARDVTPRALG